MFSIITDARVYENADPKDRNLPPLILPEGSDVPLIGGGTHAGRCRPLAVRPRGRTRSRCRNECL